MEKKPSNANWNHSIGGLSPNPYTFDAENESVKSFGLQSNLNGLGKVLSDPAYSDILGKESRRSSMHEKLEQDFDSTNGMRIKENIPEEPIRAAEKLSDNSS